jgi:hypothetical protein
MNPSLRTLLIVAALGGPLLPLAPAQSARKGTTLVQEDFSSTAIDRSKFNLTDWNIPETWELKDGALLCIYDHSKHPGKAHGKSIDPKFKAHDVRVSYKVRFLDENARLSMLINAAFPPVKTGIPVWHIGDVNTRPPKNQTDSCISISERDFTYDENHPKNVRKSHGPADIFKPLWAFEIPGINCKDHHPFKLGAWHQFVVESVGTQWTLWIDGKQTLSQTMKNADCAKESVNFIAFASLLLDDIHIEELERPSPPNGTPSPR